MKHNGNQKAAVDSVTLLRKVEKNILLRDKTFLATQIQIILREHLNSKRLISVMIGTDAVRRLFVRFRALEQELL